MGHDLLRRPVACVLIGCGLLGCALQIWVSTRLANVPYSGLDWSTQTGLVLRVADDGPAAGLLTRGEHIVAFGDTQPLQAALALDGARAGDRMQLEVASPAGTRDVELLLTQVPPLILLRRQIPVLVALVFWLVSTLVLMLRPTGAQRFLFFAFCQAFALALALGTLSDYGPRWTIRVFHVLIWWVGPVAVHLHLHFPATVEHKAQRFLISGLYLIAALGSLPDLLIDPLRMRVDDPWYFTASLLWLAFGLLLAVALLMWAYRRQSRPASRRQVGLAVLGGCVALVPFFGLLVLPYALLHTSLVPEESAFLALLVIPTTYAYAVLDVRVPRLDRSISRASAYILVLTLLVSFFIVVDSMFEQLIPAQLWRQQTATLAIVVLLTATGGPIYRHLQLGVNRVLYGDVYDYRSAVQLVSRTLDQPGDRGMLAQSMCQAIYTALPLDCVRLFLSDHHGAFVIAASEGEGCTPEQSDFRLAASGRIASFFGALRKPIGAGDLRSHLHGDPLATQELELVQHERPGLWIPLCTTDELLGLCVLDYKRGGEPFDETDLEMLQVIARLANTALQNAELIAELRSRAVESEQILQQALNAREAERKRVARELHDQTIQALVALNYQLADLRAGVPAAESEQIGVIQQTVRQTLVDVRHICADLRPPALDSLGLLPAIRSRLREIERRGLFKVTLRVVGDAEQPIPEVVALCLFRVMQEALSNIEKHANARAVRVTLHFAVDEICLAVADDGAGFTVPQQLGSLIADQHFGLVGLRERLDLVRGRFQVTSTPGAGAYLVARVPLTPAALISDKDRCDD